MTAGSIVAIVASCAGLLSTLITIVYSYKTHREDVKEKNKNKIRLDNVRKRLALHVIGYYYEETLMAEEIGRVTGETPKQVKERIRKLAEKHPDNKEQSYPKMTAQEARAYIVE
jgi:hypothetical protein